MFWFTNCLTEKNSVVKGDSGWCVIRAKAPSVVPGKSNDTDKKLCQSVIDDKLDITDAVKTEMRSLLLHKMSAMKTGTRGGKKASTFRTGIKQQLFYSMAYVSDASGNLPLALGTATAMVNSPSWGGYYAIFDEVKANHVTVRIEPLVGYRTAVALAAAKTQSSPIQRWWHDPDGALANPSVAQALAASAGSPNNTVTFSVVDRATLKYKPSSLLRQGGASVTRKSVGDWCDTGDVNTNFAQFIGGFVGNSVIAGGMSTGTPLVQAFITIDCEFRDRI
jgi:hypothetical protein